MGGPIAVGCVDWISCDYARNETEVSGADIDGRFCVALRSIGVRPSKEGMGGCTRRFTPFIHGVCLALYLHSVSTIRLYYSKPCAPHLQVSRN